jgi:M6 family metalloprotease-like protein
LTSCKMKFTVTKGTVVEAKEGAGYKTVAPTEDTLLSKYDAIGALGKGKFPTTGTRKLLVVPVTFTDAKTFSESDIALINHAYFGESSDTGWESLASYYKKSSYGKLTLTGVVTPQFVYPSASADLEKQGTGGAGSVAIAATDFAKKSGINLSDYDSDGDGYIDGLELVYKTSRTNKSDGGADLWWNFTTTTGQSPNTTTPAPYRYFWSLFSYISTGYYKPDIDCHTLIHESGHMMGLNDYYSYDKDTKAQGPAGCVDMMDMNIGDHNAYSKYMYGWVSPKVVDGSADNFTITLNSFTETGDCLIFRNTTDEAYKFNGTPYGEYNIVQYYTPTGLNQKDSTGYPEWANAKGAGSGSPYGHAGTYEKAGLQVFHVDNRLAETYGTYNPTTKKVLSTKLRYATSPKAEAVYNSDGTYTLPSVQISSNTGSESREINEDGKTMDATTNRELTFLPAKGSATFLGSSYYASMGAQSMLIGTDAYGCGGTTYTNTMMKDIFPKETTFNDGTTNNWTFSVTAQSDSTITLHFVSNHVKAVAA